MTVREEKQKQLRELLKESEQLQQSINQLARELANETRVLQVHLYKEQKDQLEDITRYFDEVDMEADQTRPEAILTMALNHFHSHLMHVKKND